MGKISLYRQKKKDDMKDKCLRLYKEGLTVREIAQIVGVSFSTVARYLRELSMGDSMTQNDTK